MKTALVTSIGSMSALSVIESLKKLGMRVIGTDINDPWLIPTAGEVSFYKAVRADNENYLSFIEELIKKENVDYLIPLTDPEVDVLTENKETIERYGTKAFIPDANKGGFLRNKKKMSELVEDVLNRNPSFREKLRIIPSVNAEELDYESVKYPLIIKPVNGRSSEGLYRVYNEDQLGFVFSLLINPEKLNDNTLSNYLIQPLINGNVVTVDVLRDKEGNAFSIAREEFIRTKNGAGLSVKVFKDRVLSEISENIAREAGITGLVNFEFIKGEGTGIYYFLECNPRFSGGTAFSTLMGPDITEAAVRCYTGENILSLSGTEIREGFAVKGYKEIITKL